MRHDFREFPLMAPADKPNGGTPAPKPAATIPPATIETAAATIPPATIVPPLPEIEMNLGAAVDPNAVTSHALKLNLAPEIEKNVPWECYGFQLDAGSREYDRKDRDAVVGRSLRVANVICRLKGSSAEASFFFLANISRITSVVAGQPARVTMSLPSSQKGGGAFASAIIKPSTPAARTAQEAWKDAVIRGPFAEWIKAQDMTAFMRNANALTQQGVVMDIPGLT